jgi:hypothetical protein
MALGSTQPLVKISTWNIPGGKGGRCISLTSPPSRVECHEIWEPKPPGTLWATPGLLRDPFTFYLQKLDKFYPTAIWRSIQQESALSNTFQKAMKLILSYYVLWSRHTHISQKGHLHFICTGTQEHKLKFTTKSKKLPQNLASGT